MWRTSIRREEGFTLTELTVSMGVFLIFLAFATPVMFSQLRQAVQTERQVDLQQTARSALRTMVRELRQASDLYASDTKPTGKNSVSFGVDLDGDTVIGSGEQIIYYLTASTLRRGSELGNGVPMAENVDEVAFTLLGSNLVLDQNGDGVVGESELNRNGNTDADGNPIWEGPEMLNVTRVRISLTMAERDETQTYAAEAFLRNRVTG